MTYTLILLHVYDYELMNSRCEYNHEYRNALTGDINSRLGLLCYCDAVCSSPLEQVQNRYHGWPELA